MLPSANIQKSNGYKPLRTAPPAPIPDALASRPAAAEIMPIIRERFTSAQMVNIMRDAAALRPFRTDEFGNNPAAPSSAHIKAANELLHRLRRQLLAWASAIQPSNGQRDDMLSPRRQQQLLQRKERAQAWIKLVEKVWNYYFKMFAQRQTQFGDWLLAADRIALDCYQAIYTNLGTPRSIPTPAPFTLMDTGLGPATFRRGVKLTRLGKRANPFPIVQLPYHRLVNPWTLGAVHHEVAHNIQSDLGLWQVVPQRIGQRLQQAGLPRSVIGVWMRWHKEMWADLCGILLGGPAIVTSLIDVLSRAPRKVWRFNPRGVHPTPYLRTLINLELLHRIGFQQEAALYDQLWRRLYPQNPRRSIPPAFWQTFSQARQLVVDTVCFQPYSQLGGKRLVDVVCFRPEHQQMTAEAAQRLAAGTDPGIVPSRFLVGASRWALERELSRPGQITTNFYQGLLKR